MHPPPSALSISRVPSWRVMISSHTASPMPEPLALEDSLIELVLHVGQLLRRDAGAVVPDGDDHLAPRPGRWRYRCACPSRRAWRRCPAGCRTPAAAAPGPPRWDRNSSVAVEVVEFDALPPEELPVGVDRILQLRLDVHGLHRQGEAAVLACGRTPAAPPPCWSAAAPRRR